MKYRKKTVVINAIKWLGTKKSNLEICEFCIGNYIGFHLLQENPQLSITTLEGVMKVDIGDYIIKGVEGEIYPCKPDIFEMTYEKEE